MRKLLLLSMVAAAVGGHGCAWNATGTIPPRQVVFEFSVQAGGQIIQSPNIAYYLVLNVQDDPSLAPLMNGSVPLSRPYPNPLSYLPFVRDDRQDFLLDREPIALPNTYWNVYYALYQEAGQMVMWQAKPNDDGTINEHFRPLQSGREWGITGGTVQINLPLNTFMGREIDDTTAPPAQLPANLAVANRGQPQYSRDVIIKRWGQVQNQSFTIPTAPGDQTIYDTTSGVTFPQNLPAGTPSQNVNLVSYHYRVTQGE